MPTISERLRDAQNARDAGLMASLFADDYRSDQPAHPGRAFTGRAQVLENWTGVFAGIPDFTSVLRSVTTSGATEWAEWHWHGTHLDGTAFAMCGVTVFDVRDGLVVEGRLYMEPVDSSGQDIDAAVQELYNPPGVTEA